MIMALSTQYNMRSPGVKRLLREAMELAEPTEEYYATPLDDNIFEWHFTVKGPSETEFEGGYYHGRILLPPQYPMQPPNIILLTPNGRFEINKKICLSISGYHPETWQPSWSIRTALLALIAFMPTKAVGTIGSLDYTPEERKVLAQKSKNWECDLCGKIAEKLISANTSHGPALTLEESNMLENIALKSEEEANRNESVAVDTSKDNVTEQSTDDSTNTGDTLRQRNIPSATEELTNAQDHLLEMTEEQRKSENFWTAIIYVILVLILLLLVRRIFFL